MQATCLHCGETFTKKNGTNTYCPDKKCQKLAKRIRQKKVDDLIKEVRKGIYANFKLFSELLPNKTRRKFPLEPLLYKGFDEHAYYGSKITTNDGVVWYIVADYYFRIITDEGRKYIDLFKL